jgi:copper resistance protein C
VALVALAAVLLPGAPAWAHTALVSSAPAKDAALTEAPTTVRLTFSQRLNPDFTTIVVSDAAKHRIPAAPPVIDQATGTVTLSEALTNGSYTVAYRVVSSDGHTVQGSYTFTVADPTQPSATASPAPASPAPATAPATSAAAALPPPDTDSGGMPTGVLIGLGSAGLLLAATALYLYFSGRRRATIRSESAA